MPNPLLIASSLPYELPDFDAITVRDYRDAIERGMASLDAEVEAIATNPEPASFDNTIVALERAGGLLRRATNAFFVVLEADGDAAMHDIEQELVPRLAVQSTRILLHPTLWERIKAVDADRESLDLRAESRFLLERSVITRRLAGADLPVDQRERVEQLTQRIAALESQFKRKLLDDTNDGPLVFDSADDLAGLTDGELRACERVAASRGLAGRWMVELTNTTQHPLLHSLIERESRRRLFEAQRARGRRGNRFDTRATVLELVRRRAELAGVFGYPNHVARAVADETARTPEAIQRLLSPMAAPARRNADAEMRQLQAEADADADARGLQRFELQAWDWAYYAERVRARTYDVDLEALRPWFEANRVLIDGLFFAANRLYGMTFTERPDLHGYHDDCRIFDVRAADGAPLGLYLHDLYSRETKQGGAWMNNLVDQSRLLGKRPVVCNTLNVPKPAVGEPTLLTLSSVTTMFHEFGHALHGLFADTEYPSLSGTRTGRDFVEFPSQVNEMWATWPEVASNYARHYQTGDPLPDGVLERLTAAKRFNQGFETSEHLAAAQLDQEWHKLPADEAVDDVDAFEADALSRTGLDNPLIPPRYSTTYFQHTFGGGYDGKYYAYLWSAVLDADTVEWFTDNGGLTRENGDRFRRELLSRGRSRDPLESYRAFRGRDAEVIPLLARRGLL